MRTRTLALTTALLATAASLALAHDTWLSAASYFVRPGTELRLELTSGMAFPALESPIRPERVQRAELHLAGRVDTLGRGVAGERALQLRARPQREGVARLRVSLGPRPIELKPDEVAHYLDEIGAPDSIRRIAAAGGPFRELYTKHALAFVRVGEPTADRSWAAPLGLPLELVPEQDPTALVPGDTLVLRVLSGGAPQPGFAVGAVREGAAPLLLRADAGGRVRVPIGGAGRYLVRGTELRRSSQPNVDWESDFVTLTFAVRERAR